jgi:redox-sensing transcriptional repressor
VIVGAGNLGSALAAFGGFRERGFEVVGVVDVDPGRIGRGVGGLLVGHEDDLDRIVAEHDVAIGVVAVPPSAAQEAADRLVACGVRSILNFAPTVLDVPEEVQVRNVDLAVELQILAFHEGRRSDPVEAAAPSIGESASA